MHQPSQLQPPPSRRPIRATGSLGPKAERKELPKEAAFGTKTRMTKHMASLIALDQSQQDDAEEPNHVLIQPRGQRAEAYFQGDLNQGCVAMELDSPMLRSGTYAEFRKESTTLIKHEEGSLVAVYLDHTGGPSFVEAIGVPAALAWL